VETIHSPLLGFFRGVFLVNHLASTDNTSVVSSRGKTQSGLTFCYRFIEAVVEYWPCRTSVVANF